jgi:hypothetical protein
MPEAGGANDQANLFLEAADVVDGLNQYWRAKLKIRTPDDGR